MKKNLILSLIFALYLMQAQSQDNLNASRIGVWPYGPGNAIASYEEYIFLSYGRTVQIYEYSNPEQPQMVGELFLDDMIFAFAFDAGKAYVAGYNRFFILNIMNPAQPEIISSISIEARANAIQLNNGYVYLALHGTGIGIVDISDVQNPFLHSVFETNQASYKMVISNNIAWVPSGNHGLTAFDISDPLSPELVLTYNESGSMHSVAITDSLLYTTNSITGIMVFDISSLPDITLLSSTSTISNGINLHIHDNLLAVSLISNGFSLYDISDPIAPDSLSSFYAEWPNRNTILKNGHAFHCHVYDFNIIDISVPQEMNLLAQTGLSGISQYVHYWENHLFISSYSSALIMVVDVSDPQQAVKISQIEGGDGHITIHVKDDLLFTNTYHWLKIYDVSEPSDPVYLNTIVASTTITNVLKHNELLFVSDYDNLQIFNITDIHNPELLGIYAIGGIDEMIVENNYLYYVNFSDFVILDISDPANLVQLSVIDNMSTTSVAVKDSLAYVVSSIYPSIYEHSLKIFNVQNPGSASLISGHEPSRHFEQVIIEGDYLYVFEEYVGLNIYDIQGIQPVLCGFYSLGSFVSKMTVQEGISYIPAWAGVDIVQNDLLSSAGGIFIQREERLKLFPNPASDMIRFMLDDSKHSGTFSYEIIQVNGSGIKSGKLSASQTQISLDGLPAGVYVLHLRKAGERYKSGLFVKQ